MQTVVGTSGYSYKEWKGSFYPEKLPAAKMLPFYAERFTTVEINNTFYRMPDGSTLARWASQVPASFTFALKAPQRITHQKRLGEVQDDVRYLFEAAAALERKLGPVLFQLPPYFRRDLERLRSFVALLPPEREVAFEFRHDSWVDDSVFEVLRKRDAAVCLSDTDEVSDPDALVVPTARWGYLRLRRTDYPDAVLQAWVERIRRQPWDRAYIFFKHEDEGKGPAFAKRFLEVWAGGA